MSVFIRECTVADVPELEAICQETFADTYGDGETKRIYRHIMRGNLVQQF